MRLSVLLRRPRATLVSGSGLLKLVKSARIPYQAAQDFKDWVTNTVLPYIRGEAYAGTPFRQKVIGDLRKNHVPAARPPAVIFDCLIVTDRHNRATDDRHIGASLNRL